MLLEIKDLSCRYDQDDVLKNLSLELPQGELACVLGPSGCGKTTLLRCLAGFEPLSSGEIYLAGQRLDKLDPEKRRLGMVFQDYALFPNLTIDENICFGIRKQSAAEQSKRLDTLLELTGLGQFRDRYPHELSGGQQQRVALARALAPKPDLILMDEPFSNLDLALRRSLGVELRDVLKDQGSSVLMVTHDQEEAFIISDRVGLLRDGMLQQWDHPERVYHDPINPWVAAFIGQVSWIAGHVTGETTAQTLLGRAIVKAQEMAIGQRVRIAVRPEDLSIAESELGNGKVVDVQFRGNHCLYQVVMSDGETLLGRGSNRVILKRGTQVEVALTLVSYPVFPE